MIRVYFRIVTTEIIVKSSRRYIVAVEDNIKETDMFRGTIQQSLNEAGETLENSVGKKLKWRRLDVYWRIN
jgi:hypothetical protein